MNQFAILTLLMTAASPNLGAVSPDPGGDEAKAALEQLEAAVATTDQVYEYRTKSWTEFDGRVDESSRMSADVMVGPRIGRRGIFETRPYLLRGTGFDRNDREVSFAAAFDGQDREQAFPAEKVVRTERVRPGEEPNSAKLFSEDYRKLLVVDSALLPGLGGIPMRVLGACSVALDGREEFAGGHCVVIVATMPRRTVAPASDFGPAIFMETEFRVLVDAETGLPRRSHMQTTTIHGDEVDSTRVAIVECVGDVRMAQPPPTWRVARADDWSDENLSRERPAPRVAVGDPAPGFVLRAGRETVRLADLRGKVVVLDFWSSWYAPSRAAVPELQRLHDSLSKRGVAIYGVSFEEYRGTDPAAVLRDLNATYPCLAQGDLTARSYGIVERPARVVIDADGQIAALLFDDEPDLSRRLHDVLDPLLGR